MTPRLLAVLMALLPTLTWAQGVPRTPLLIEGKQSLYQRVIARPGATLSPRPDGQDAHPVPGFTVYYVYARPPGDAARIEVGRTADGRPEGWLQAGKAIDAPGTCAPPRSRRGLLQKGGQTPAPSSRSSPRRPWTSPAIST